MKVTLLDAQDLVLTEITSHVGRSPGQMLVDWATRPDALFQYYFDRGGRTVTVVVGAAMWSAVLGTRWQMGARFWFLRRVRSRPRRQPWRAGQAALALDSGPAAAMRFRALGATASAALDAPAAARTSEPRGVPA